MQRYSARLLRKVRQHLRSGGVIAYPTESCYGFGCDPFNSSALDRILRIKGRSKQKGLIVIAGEQRQLKTLCADDYHQNDFLGYWPGFYTLLLTANPDVLPSLIGKHSKIALRVSKHPLVRQLCHNISSPLVSTSANRAGHRPIRNYRDCLRQFGHALMVLPGYTYFARKQSTIIDWETKRVLR